MIIRTPDQRLRVFVSSTLQELAAERAAVKEAIQHLRLAPVMFELGARPHPPKELYRAYLEQSHIFIAIYWERYGWVAPDMTISGLEDEWQLSGNRPKLIYLKSPSPNREDRLKQMLDDVRNDANVSYKSFSTIDELRQLVQDDLALLLTERFEMATQANQPTAASISNDSTLHFENLPAYTNEFIGRADEIEAVSKLLLEANVRLITLTGAGGIGKSRLAIEVGRQVQSRFEDGVCLVSLAEVTQPNRLFAAIAHSLGIQEPEALDVEQRVKDVLRNKHLLLILDNFEQIAAAAPLLSDLLTSAAQLEVIVTSRSVLQVRGEHQFVVQPLGLLSNRNLGHGLFTQADANAEPSEAMCLFVARARAARTDFAITTDNSADIAEICARLDGLPLAIELAAARIRLFEPHELLDRLRATQNQTLSSNAPDLPVRQRRLRNTLDWSYALLSAEEQDLFTRLSIFSGGCTLAAAEAVLSNDGADVIEGLTSLIDKSLVIHQTSTVSDDIRFGMLNTVRDYALELLKNRTDANAIRQRHAEYFVGLAQRAASALRSPQQRVYLDLLEQDLENIQTSLSWLLENNQPKLAVDLVWALRPFWFARAHLNESLRWMTEALAQLDIHQTATDAQTQRTRVEIRAKALSLAGFAAAVQQYDAWANVLLTEGMALLAANPNPSRDEHAVLAMLNAGRAYQAIYQFKAEEARANFAAGAAHFKQSGDLWGAAMLLNGLGAVALQEGDLVAMRQAHNESLAISQRAGDDVSATFALLDLALGSLKEGDSDTARRQLGQALNAAIQAGYRDGIASCIEAYANFAHQQNAMASAVKLMAMATALREALHLVRWRKSGTDEDLSAQLRAQMPASAEFDAWWTAGQRLTLSQALELARTL